MRFSLFFYVENVFFIEKALECCVAGRNRFGLNSNSKAPFRLCGLFKLTLARFRAQHGQQQEPTSTSKPMGVASSK